MADMLGIPMVRALCGLVMLGLVGCQIPGENEEILDTEDKLRQRSGSILGGDVGIKLLGGEEDAGAIGSGIAVNSFLWRASLDTLSFLPMQEADPFGGVILTDWYNPPDTPNQRIKVNLYILDRALRSDALRVAVFRQTRRNGEWVDDRVAEETAREVEDTILTRARQLRIDQVTG